MRSYRVADWMSAPEIVVEPTCALVAAQQLMEQHHMRRILVVDQGRLAGMLTWDNLLSAQRAAAAGQADQLCVLDGMITNPTAIAPDISVGEAAQLLVDRKLGVLPVVDHGLLVGVITEGDLFLLLHSDVGARPAEESKPPIACTRCGAPLRGRSIELIAPDDQCPHCHYHLHRCDNCRYFDGVACMLDRADRHSGVPGQHCPAFSFVPPRAVGRNG
jgi:CBS domain-containing protein